MNTITKKNLAKKLWLDYAAFASLKDIDEMLTALFHEIGRALAQGNRVQIVGFGTFEVRQRRSLDVINPRTGERMNVPAHKLPAFRAGTNLKRAVQTGDNACKSF